MENKANYALIGAFVLVAVAAIIGFVLWLTDAQLDQQFDEYQVEFSGPVRGLSAGSEVRFNGIAVGSVTAIRLDPEDPNVVLANIQVDPNTPVDTRSYAALEPLGLTGLNYLQIFAGGEQYPRLKDSVPRGLPRFRGEGDQISGLLDGGGTVVDQAQVALARITMVLSDENIENFNGILANLNRLTAELDVSDFDIENVNALVGDLRQTAQSFETTAESIQQTASAATRLIDEDAAQLLIRVDKSLDEIDTTLVTYRGVGGNVDELVVDVRDAINRLSNSGLTDLEETVDAIRRLVTSLGRVADALEQNPLAFISGQEVDAVELPQ
jgi:phospholipid/cholesterol/gamma-HCH transport system substrate-binding protein